jgi:tetratricopeptide (TPR) repeat protein
VPRLGSGVRASVTPPPPLVGIGVGVGDRLSPAADMVSAAAVVGLVDRLLALDDGAFFISWVESLQIGRQALDVGLAARLVRAYREMGRHDRARDIAAAIAPAPAAGAGSPVTPIDLARLAVERAFLSIAEGRPEHAEGELRQASRALAQAPRGAGSREQLDVHLASAQLELRLGRQEPARASLRLAEHVAERLEEGMPRVAVSLALGHLSMRLSDPRAACKHYAASLERAPARSPGAMRAHGNLAIALSAVGRYEEARQNAIQAIAIAADGSGVAALASGGTGGRDSILPGPARDGAAASGGGGGAAIRHADAYDVLATVEIVADQPLAALQALDEAWSLLGEADAPALRLQIAQHRAWALALAGRAPSAKQWLSKVEELRAGAAVDDVLDEQDYAMTRARTLEASGELEAALAFAIPHTARATDAFVTGVLNLVVARCADSLGEEATARAGLERAAVSGDKHGWIFPERAASSTLWEVAAKGGDSRVVRYAERVLAVTTVPQDSASVSVPPLSLPPPSLYPSMPPPSLHDLAAYTGGASSTSVESAADAEALLYVTTPSGVSRVKASEIPQATAGAGLVVDTRSHHLRVADRAVSLERRRALEPLVVQLLRRAREGLSAEEILRAAGGPGPDSADAEHRVRVLISRVRDLLGDPAAIERVRDAGEYGKTRYRLAGGLVFALIEPLFAAGQH